MHDETVETKVGTGGREQRVGQEVLHAVSHDLGGCQGLSSGTARGQVYMVWAFADQTGSELVKTCNKANEGLVSHVATMLRC